MDKETHCRNQVSTHTMLETTTKIPKLVSPNGDESPLCHLLSVLPDELIYDILLRVPVRSLVKFKCVCKSWKVLISDPQFAKDHLFISTSNPNMTDQQFVYSISNLRDIVSFSVQSLFQNPSKPAKPHSLRMSHRYQILGSCNGLLCLLREKQCYVELELWNPFTGLKSKRLSIRYEIDCLCFHGLGYDHVNHRYKVIVGIVGVEERVEIETKIYSFGSNSCTVIKNQKFLQRDCDTIRQAKFVSGTLNWIVKRGISDGQWVIRSLDMVTEIFGEVLLPEVDEGGDKIHHPVLAVMRNCLCVCFFDSMAKKAHWIVLLMKEYGVQNSWIKLLMTPHINLLRGYRSYFDPLYISENGVVLLISWNKLMLYNSNDGRLVYTGIRGKHMHIYLQTLVSPEC